MIRTSTFGRERDTNEKTLSNICLIMALCLKVLSKSKRNTYYKTQNVYSAFEKMLLNISTIIGQLEKCY